MGELAVETTAIPGLLVVHLPVHGDARGWLKENWQRAKMTALGLPDFGPVQQTISFNAAVGVTRGFHAEPWDKFVSVASGKVHGAWVDLRAGDTFGMSVHFDITPDVAVFLPRGVANAFQTLEPDTVYSYLVNDHWSPEAIKSYTYLNLADESVAIPWPIPLDESELSDADRHHPRLADVIPVPAPETWILGGNGQVGRALATVFPDAKVFSRPEVDLADPQSLHDLNWRACGTVINAAAYTAVDAAETPDGRRECWAVNVTGVRHLTELCRKHRVKLVHISSDYVFDGTADEHDEDEAPSPLGFYGATKAAADEIVASLPNHLIVRTSWVVGDGKNFVATMAGLADRGVSPSVVNDQIGRLTFADDLAQAIRHLLVADAKGIVNVTSAGEPCSWFDIAQQIFTLRGRSADDVSAVSTADYSAGKPMSPRPVNSTLTLDKLRDLGCTPRDSRTALTDYLTRLK